ncbi:MAG: hypothetical protein DLM50_08550 [Candidatus Meridianibacter frigidus]|nr:MAG: hypothetical protein DLM50_08550 [Candidatus Eremiobacteraeota bacterium]
MRRAYLTLALVAVAAGIVPAVVTADQPDPTAILTPIYARMDAALQKKDLSATRDLIADDFSGKAFGKTATKDSAIADATQGFAQITEIKKFETKLSNVHYDGSNIVADATGTIDGTLTTGNALEVVASSTDTWAQRDGKWLEIASVSHEQVVSVDGKIVQHDVEPSPAP